jgi:hypothetical protein
MALKGMALKGMALKGMALKGMALKGMALEATASQTWGKTQSEGCPRPIRDARPQAFSTAAFRLLH